MVNDDVRFYIGEMETSAERLNILIPRQYRKWFDGFRFEDMHHLSMALMHASCADEARYYNRDWKVEEYENDLKRTLSK